MQKAYLIDASIYVFRAWFTLPDTLVNADDEPVGAVYGFADFLLNLLERERPDYLLCAFDESLNDSAYRHQIYPDYKANRESAPDVLKRQFALCRQLLTKLGIYHQGHPAYEADDIIGSASVQLRHQGLRNMIISGDKDLTQLVRGQDLWWEYGRDQQLCQNKVKDKFGVWPDQIADLLALAGDKVDNIPGVPGIGAKTAAKLLVKYGTLDNLLANLSEIANMKFRGAKRTQDLLITHQAQARLSKQLTDIVLDLNLGWTQAIQLKPDLPDIHDAVAFMRYLGFGQQRINRWHRLQQSTKA